MKMNIFLLSFAVLQLGNVGCNAGPSGVGPAPVPASHPSAESVATPSTKQNATTPAALARTGDAAPPERQAHAFADPLITAAAKAALVQKGTFTQPGPFPPVIAPCVDDDPIAVTGTWNGWFRVAQTDGGHVHVTEHIDWSDVTLVATDGRTWKPGPGAHESFSLNLPATPGDLGESAYTVMHNLRARFNSQDGASDLQVWHTIHIVRGPDLEFRLMKIVLPFQGECIGAK